MLSLRKKMPIRNLPAQQKNAQDDKTLYRALLAEDELAGAAIRHIEASRMPLLNKIDLSKSEFLGQHLLAEFKVEKISLEPMEFEKIVREGAILAGATVLCANFFKNVTHGGISGIVVIQESHFTIHYLPKEGLVAFDAFTCGNIDFKLTLAHIQNKLNIKPYDEIEIKRGIRRINDQTFIPGIAKKNASDFLFFKPDASASSALCSSLGQHIIAEFYCCHPGKINKAKFVLDAFCDAINECNVPIKFSYVHEFQPQGISAVIVGDGFHLTIHDWPEYGYGSVDLCTFNDGVSAQQVIKFLQDQFQAQRVSTHQFPRGNYLATTDNLFPVFSQLEPQEMGERPVMRPNPIRA